MNLVLGLVVGGMVLIWLVAWLARRWGGGRWNGYGYDYDSGDWSDRDSGFSFWPAWLWWNSSSNDSPSVSDSQPPSISAADACPADGSSAGGDCGGWFSSDGGGFSGDSGGGGCDCGSGGGGGE